MKSTLVCIIVWIVFSSIVHAKEQIRLTTFESCPYVCDDSEKKGFLIDIVEKICKNEDLDVQIDILRF